MADATLENQVSILANQETILAKLAEIQAALTGTGSIQVDHDFGGTDALRIVDGDGNGIDGVWIQAFLKSDYDAGHHSSDYAKGTTQTTTTGRWIRPIVLDPETYTLVAYKENVYGPDTVEITVEEGS
jgi:hypothetical protein